MTWIYIFFALIAVVLLAAYYAYRMAFYSPLSKRPDPFAPTKGKSYLPYRDLILKASQVMDRYQYEEVWIQSYDGKRLRGRYYHICDNAPLEILFHGYRSTCLRDCSGGHALSRKLKLNTLVVDQRAQGKSEGVTITFGIKERLDCLSWIQYANNRFGNTKPIVISGLSMGAGTVLMASDLDLPSNVQAIIADSGYTSPMAIIEKVCADLHYPLFLCRPLVRLGAALFGKFNIKESSAIESVKHNKIPTLLIHGETDSLVPCYMSKEIYAAAEDHIQLCTFPDAGHGLAFMVDPSRYEKVIYEFLLTIPAMNEYFEEYNISI